MRLSFLVLLGLCACSDPSTAPQPTRFAELDVAARTAPSFMARASFFERPPATLTDPLQTAEQALTMRRFPAPRLPALANGAFSVTVNGVTLEVEEPELSGAARLDGAIVSYGTPHRASHFQLTANGFEEWVEVANAGAGPVATWTVQGARLAMLADGTVTVSTHDRVVALVNAPFAVNEEGTRFRAWLEVSGERLALFTEARGHVLVDPSWTATVASSVPRWQHSATLLTDGRVLIVGGRQDSTTLQTQVELFDPARGFVTANPLTTGRAFHTATRLPSGRVLVFGGETGAAAWTGTAELYTPSTGMWTTVTATSTARARHTATLLPDGSVLLAGGTGTGGTALGSAVRFIENASAPATSTFAAAGMLTAPRRGHTAVRLRNGTVLVTGGSNAAVALASAETYDPGTNGWTATTAMATPRTEHTATLLPTGEVLFAGGADLLGTKLSTSALYQPASRTFLSGPAIPLARSQHAALLTPQGHVMIVGGATSCGPIVTNCAVVLDPALSTSTNLAGASTNRTFATLTQLPNGRALLVGGMLVSNMMVQSSAELGLWASPSLVSSALANARSGHTATLLHTGRVLVAGGAVSGGAPTATSEVFDPVSNGWALTGIMGLARRQHTATLLNDGRVLAVGGDVSGGNPTQTVELYSPATGTWVSGPPLTTARQGHVAVLMRNGAVVVAGGFGSGSVALASTEVYSPNTNTWAPGPMMPVARANATATFLPTDLALIAGGTNGTGPLTSTEVFDGGVFRAGMAMTIARESHSATLLPSGQVLLAGGNSMGQSNLFDSTTLAISSADLLGDPRAKHAAALFRDGTVLAAGGAISGVTLNSAESFEPVSTGGSGAGNWGTSLSLSTASTALTATTLFNGDVLFVGGENSGAPITDVRRHGWDAGESVTLRPTLTGVPTRVSPNTSFTLSGTQFLGFGEGASGNTQSSSSAFPILEVDRISSATRSRPIISSFSDTSLTVDGGLRTGLYVVRVITQGVPSAPALLPVFPPLTISPPSPTVPPRGAVTFTGSGSGGAGYLWSLTTNGSGGGVDGGAYVAGPTGSTSDTVRVSDLFGNAATATVMVGPGVSISPSPGNVPPRGTLALTAMGGSNTGFTWSMDANPSDGGVVGSMYRAGAIGNVTDVVRATDSLSNFGLVSIQVGPGVSVSPSAPTVPPRAGRTFTASGGSNTGFVWVLVTNNSGATFDGGPAGYQAGTAAGAQDTLQVTDSLGNTGQALVTVGASLLPTPASATVAPRQVLTLSAAGGMAPYVWGLFTNQSGGSITTDAGLGVYIAGPTPNRVDTVRVSDSVGSTGDVVITVGPGVSVSPPALTIPPRGRSTFTASGGSNAGFNWSIASSTAGTVDAGSYVASATPNVTEVVRATDSLGNVGSATVTVTDGVSLTPRTLTLAPGATTTFSARGGSDAGFVFSLLTNGSDGGIGSSTGAYRAGPEGNRIDVVRVVDSLSNEAQATVQVTAGISVTPPSASTPPLGQISFGAMGGAGSPYTFSLQANPSGGSVDGQGVYTAGTIEATDVLRVTDGNGNVATVSIAVTNALALTPSSVTLAPRQPQAFTATGGSMVGYTFTLVANTSGASLDGGLYTAGVGSGIDTLRVQDSLGAMASATITVGPQVSVMPATTSLVPRSTLTFSASGGTNAGFTWALRTNASGGTVSAAGEYTAGTMGGTADVLEATDSLGNTGTAAIAVSAGISIAPIGVVAPSDDALLTAVGGAGGPYRWSLATNRSGGRINQLTGDYTAGATPDVSDVVQATDALGNFGTLDVRVGPGITISPSGLTVSPGAQQQFTATGGTNQGFSWSIRTNLSQGRIDPQGLYTAGTVLNVFDVVEVTDSRMNRASVNVRVGSPLVVEPASANQAPRSSRLFVATGGLEPLTWTLSLNGSGASLDGGFYVAGATPNVEDRIKVTDALNTERTVVVNVTAGVTLTPTTATARPDEVVQFQAMGGSNEGFTWVLNPNSSGGTLDQTGRYVAGASAGDDQVVVTDSLGNGASATVIVAGNSTRPFSQRDPVSGFSCGCQSASFDGAVVGLVALLFRRRRASQQPRSAPLLKTSVVALLLLSLPMMALAAPAKKGKGTKPARTQPTTAPTPAVTTPPPPVTEPPPAPTPIVEPAVTSAPRPRAGPPSLAVPDVTVTVPNETLDAAAFSDMLVAAAEGQGAFKVISSKDIRTAVGAERQRQLLGCSENTSCAAEIANALGAELLLSASVGKVAENYLVSAEVMSGSSSKVLGRGTAQVTDANALLAAIWSAAEQAFDGYGAGLTPAEAERWKNRVRAAPPAILSATRTVFFGGTVSAVGGWQVLSEAGRRGSLGVQVDLTVRVVRFDLALGLIIAPKLGARVTATWALLASRLRLMAGLRGTGYPELGLYGGGPVVSTEFAFLPWLAASASGGADFFPSSSGLVVALLGNLGVALHF